MPLYIRDSDNNLISRMEASKTAQWGETQEEFDDVFNVTLPCYKELMVYEDGMPVSIFPTGFLFRACKVGPDLPDNLPRGKKFKVDGWVVAKEKILKFVTIAVRRKDDFIKGHRT